MPAPTVDAYLARIRPDHRTALERLRRQIHGAAPGLTEKISYGIPTFVLDGRSLVAMASFREHCTFFAGSIVQDLRIGKLLEGFSVSKGGVRFTPEGALSASTVTRIVKARIAQRLAGSATGKSGERRGRARTTAASASSTGGRQRRGSGRRGPLPPRPARARSPGRS